ncbi:hypothetical protein KCU73_g952, partial [Aureobasidium melanogenum]
MELQNQDPGSRPELLHHHRSATSSINGAQTTSISSPCESVNPVRASQPSSSQSSSEIINLVAGADTSPNIDIQSYISPYHPLRVGASANDAADDRALKSDAFKNERVIDTGFDRYHTYTKTSSIAGQFRTKHEEYNHKLKIRSKENNMSSALTAREKSIAAQKGRPILSEATFNLSSESRSSAHSAGLDLSTLVAYTFGDAEMLSTAHEGHKVLQEMVEACDDGIDRDFEHDGEEEDVGEDAAIELF